MRLGGMHIHTRRMRIIDTFTEKAASISTLHSADKIVMVKQLIDLLSNQRRWRRPVKFIYQCGFV